MTEHDKPPEQVNFERLRQEISSLEQEIMVRFDAMMRRVSCIMSGFERVEMARREKEK